MLGCQPKIVVLNTHLNGQLAQDLTAPSGYFATLRPTTGNQGSATPLTLECGDASHYLVAAAEPSAKASGWTPCTNGPLALSIRGAPSGMKLWLKNPAGNVARVPASLGLTDAQEERSPAHDGTLSYSLRRVDDRASGK